MGNLNTSKAADSIDAWTSPPVVLRPHWPNPACEGGAVIEVSTNLTVGELASNYRDKLIGATYAAQALVVHCVVSQDAPESKPIMLDSMRSETDMIWHTDKVQRDFGSVNIIVGHSSIPTGLAPKPMVRRKAQEQAKGNDAQWSLKKLYGHWLDYDELEMPFSDKTSYYLHSLHAVSVCADEEVGPEMSIEAAKLTRQRVAFWEDIRALNADPEILWFGERSAEHPDTETALFVSRMLFHNRGFAPPGTPRDGNKHRLELRPNNGLRQDLDDRFGGLRFDKPSRGIDAEWLRAL